MSKQNVRISNDQPGQIRWQAIGSFAGITCLFVSSIIATWIFTASTVISTSPILLITVLLVGLHSLIVLAGERFLAYTPVTQSWRYRLAFLISVAIGGIYWLVSFFASTQQRSFAWLMVALFGALVGSILATWLHEPLWEDNSPPSAFVQAEVHRWHVQVSGPPADPPGSKRLFDVILALLGLVLSAPVWLLIVFLVWLEEPGPVLFVKNSVGLGGINFHQFKFRTMVHGAEQATGPVLASQSDDRVLLIGKVLRKTALDELPQLLNILKGEMSFVGPRPQRTVLVYSYLQQMPAYSERHQVLPGLAGLAQVAGDYYLTPRQKLRFDRLYIRHSNLGFDLKLLALAFLITFWYRWQTGWDGRLPRRLLHPS